MIGPRIFVLCAVVASTGCAHPAPSVAVSLDGSPPIAAEAGPPADDWNTYAHDQLRTGYQPQRTALTRSNVARLRLRWRFDVSQSVQASPLVAGGRVFVESSMGEIYALDVTTGKPRWMRKTSTTIAMTPSLADGKLFVGDHRENGMVTAFDATSGRTIWRSAPIPGGIRTEPAIARGTVFVGETTGDPPVCHQGGIHALDERSGRERWKWSVDPKPHEGGAVWSPISYDRGRIFFGSGNTCEGGIATANAAIALGLDGTLAWAYNTANAVSDSDIGGGASILHGHVLIASKNGTLYDVDERTGALNWATALGGMPGYGSIGTPASDGRTIVVSAGFLSDPTQSHAAPGGALVGLDTAGKIRWVVRSREPISGSVAIANGIAYTPIDDAFEALDVQTGAVLWRFRQGVSSYASPAVVPSGVYFADAAGRVFAFGLPARLRS